MQCAQLVKDGGAWAVGSQDYDALVVGGSRLLQNLTLSKKRKTVNGYVDITTEIIDYQQVLNELEINSDQLISLAILVGTDFNPKGIKGIGPKKALGIVGTKKYPVEIFKEFEEQGNMDFNWKEIFEIFKKPNVNKNPEVKFSKLDSDKIREILVERHDFSLERVNNQIDKLKENKSKGSQKKL